MNAQQRFLDAASQTHGDGLLQISDPLHEFSHPHTQAAELSAAPPIGSARGT